MSFCDGCSELDPCDGIQCLRTVGERIDARADRWERFIYGRELRQGRAPSLAEAEAKREREAVKAVLYWQEFNR